MTRWLLLDYGGVLCTPQPEEAQRALVEAAGVGADAFWAAYWVERPAYDRGELSSAAYWEKVAGSAPVDELNRLDVASWSHPQDASLELIGGLEGYELALLSNAPHPLADAIDEMDWMTLVPRRYYSCRLGLTKPDRAAYDAVLAELGAGPADVTFVDDRPENVDGAREAGLTAVLFTDPADLGEL